MMSSCGLRIWLRSWGASLVNERCFVCRWHVFNAYETTRDAADSLCLVEGKNQSTKS